MSAPQLTDASTSSEWFRKVGEAGTADKPRSPSQASISQGVGADRRKRFVRLVTYTMAGLVAFTLLGVASFAWRQHAMQSALTAPLPAAASPAIVAPSPTPELAPEASAPPPASDTAAAAAPVAARAPTKASAAVKASKKPAARSPFLSKLKPSTPAKR